MNNSYDHYFEGCDVRPEFLKEIVSLWSGWLGEENLHELDTVTEGEWSRFNDFVRLISKRFKTEIVNCESESISSVYDIENTLSTYNKSKEKTASEFSTYILPELECVISEDWDYTYIIWHKNNGAIESLIPFISEAGLRHFSD